MAALSPTFFATPEQWRAWLSQHHANTPELWVGFYKAQSGRPSITWPQAVDEALCFGWIDGQRRSVDSSSYAIRFTPRRAGSNWSAVNVARVRAMTKEGRMRPEGLKAFEARAAEKTGVYSYENRQMAELNSAEEKRFKAQTKAWAFFKAKAPSYRSAAVWWVVSAKRPETRQKRLSTLIEDSAHGRTVKPLTRPKPKKP
jgi:uncharacterized protein YdeI (YjbR/CyaY-like superfamily)